MCFSKYIGHGLNKLLPTDAGGSIFISSCRLNYIEVSLRIACEVLVVAYACLCIHGLDIIMASQTETVCVVKAFVLSTPHLESRVQLHRISHMHAKCVHTHFPQYGWQFSDRSLLDLGSAESYIRTAGPLPRPGFQTNCIFFFLRSFWLTEFPIGKPPRSQCASIRPERGLAIYNMGDLVQDPRL